MSKRFLSHLAVAKRALWWICKSLILLALLVDAQAEGLLTGAQAVYVGTDGRGLRALRFDAQTADMTMLGTMVDVSKPRWLVQHPSLPVVYAAIDGDGQEGSVRAYALDRASGALTLVNETPAGGAGATHLLLDAGSKTLMVANFGGGSVSSMVIRGDGSLGPRTSTIQATGSGPHRRQASPHAHGTALDPSGHYVLVADMGADRVFVYGLDRSRHALLPDEAAPPRSLSVAPGSGPRRVLFGRSGRFVYVLNELSAELLTLQWDAQAARLTLLRTQPLSSPDYQGAKSASEMMLSHDGRHLYVADRGEHTLVVFSVHPVTGELTLLQRLPSGGMAPWAFDLHRSGKWMLVANYRSDQLNLFSIDPDSGRLTDAGRALASPRPVSVAFVY